LHSLSEILRKRKSEKFKYSKVLILFGWDNMKSIFRESNELFVRKYVNPSKEKIMNAWKRAVECSKRLDEKIENLKAWKKAIETSKKFDGKIEEIVSDVVVEYRSAVGYSKELGRKIESSIKRAGDSMKNVVRSFEKLDEKVVELTRKFSGTVGSVGRSLKRSVIPIALAAGVITEGIFLVHQNEKIRKLEAEKNEKARYLATLEKNTKDLQASLQNCTKNYESVRNQLSELEKRNKFLVSENKYLKKEIEYYENKVRISETKTPIFSSSKKISKQLSLHDAITGKNCYIELMGIDNNKVKFYVRKGTESNIVTLSEKDVYKFGDSLLLVDKVDGNKAEVTAYLR
jgi:DNA repair exonuclease SbcCD ATPase subunit